MADQSYLASKTKEFIDSIESELDSLTERIECVDEYVFVVKCMARDGRWNWGRSAVMR